MFALSFFYQRTIAAAAVLAVCLTAIPAFAAHVITRQTAAKCTDCEFGPIAIDVSRGYPIVVTSMMAGSENPRLFSLMVTRPTGQAASSAFGTDNGIIRTSSGWATNIGELFMALSGQPAAAAVSPCNGADNCKNSVKSSYVGTDANGNGQVVTYTTLVDDQGNAGKTYTALTPLEKIQQGLTDVLAVYAPDQVLHTAFWNDDGLQYYGHNQEANTFEGGGLIPNDYISDWPYTTPPPTDLGYWGDNNDPYVVWVNGKNQIIADAKGDPEGFEEDKGIRKPDGWKSAQVDLSDVTDTVSDTSKVKVGKGTKAPSATVTVEETTVAIEDLTEPEQYRPLDREHCAHDGVLLPGVFRSYYVCHALVDNTIRVVVNEKELVGDKVKVVQQGIVHVAAVNLMNMQGAAYKDGKIHICLYGYKEEGGKEVKVVEWIEVEIDENDIEWQPRKE